MLRLSKYSISNYKLWAVLLLIVLYLQGAKAQKPLKFTNTTISSNNIFNGFNKDKTSIVPTVTSFSKDGIFDSKSRTIGYTLKLQNKLKEEQIGEIMMQISNHTGAVLYKEILPFAIRKKGVFEKKYVFANGQLQPGFYVSSMSISTGKYADTITHNFGYEPSKIVSKLSPPADFVSFWDNAKRELAATKADFIVTPRPDLSTKKNDAFEVEYKSIDKGIIYGWLTTPKNKRNNPVLYKISDYQGELTPEYRNDIAVLTINSRGTGASNQNYNFAYNDLGTYNLKDRNRYVLKGIYMDALRGLDFISQFASTMKLDTRKIIATGSGLGAASATVLAAIDSRLKGIILDGPSFIGMRDMINFGEGTTTYSFPASMFINYYNSKKVSKESVIKTLEYFDPVYFAPYISCPVLTGFSLHNTNIPAQCVYTFIGQLRVAKKDKYECKDCGNSLDRGFYGFKEAWIKERFGQP